MSNHYFECMYIFIYVLEYRIIIGRKLNRMYCWFCAARWDYEIDCLFINTSYYTSQYNQSMFSVTTSHIINHKKTLLIKRLLSSTSFIDVSKADICRDIFDADLCQSFYIYTHNTHTQTHMAQSHLTAQLYIFFFNILNFFQIPFIWMFVPVAWWNCPSCPLHMQYWC